MTKQKLTLSLDSDVIDKLKAGAERAGVSASALITIMLNERLEGVRQNQNDLDVLERIESHEMEIEEIWKVLNLDRPAKVKQMAGNYALIKHKDDL